MRCRITAIVASDKPYVCKSHMAECLMVSIPFETLISGIKTDELVIS